MQLTHFKLCPFSRAARLLLGELGLSPELVETRPWALSRMHLLEDPSGRLPLIRRNDGHLLCGFYALSEFIVDCQDRGDDVVALLAGAPADDEDTPQQLVFLPENLDDRAEVRRLVDWFNGKCNAEVTQELIVEKVRTVLDRSAGMTPNIAMLKAARANLRYHLDYLGFLADKRRWIAGETLTIADFVAAAHISIIDYLDEVDWRSAPHVEGWYERLKSRRSFRPLLADRIPGLTPPAHYGELDF
ncbi:MAG: glutathione S-transferase family protein [Pseudomonadota bacterium]